MNDSTGDDRAAIAHDLYAHLTNHGTTPPEPQLAAAALYTTPYVTATPYPNRPIRWAAWIHTGH